MHEYCLHTCTCNFYIQLHEENQNSGVKFTSNMFAFETFLWTYQTIVGTFNDLFYDTCRRHPKY